MRRVNGQEQEEAIAYADARCGIAGTFDDARKALTAWLKKKNGTNGHWKHRMRFSKKKEGGK